MGKKVYLRWNNLEVSVPPPKPSLFDRARSAIRGQDGEGVQTAVQPEGRKILRKINGVARPGDLIALMGSSGAGKTTLLNTLSRRNIGSLDVDGEILVNGRPVGKNIGSVSAYVQQEDVFLTTLTVREHLQFQAMLRMNTEIPAAKRYERVEEVIQELGLQGCSDSKIGNNRTVQGISGGERKRLSFASEVLEDPPLLFADEPTSGLDSFKAGSVVQALRNLADKGRTIICTIHQPPSEVFGMFNRLMLLSEGRTAYLGGMEGAVKHFAGLGYTCPEDYNPADFFVFTLAIIPGKEEECREKVGKINDAYALVERELCEADLAAPVAAPFNQNKNTKPVDTSIPTLMLTELKAPGDVAEDGISVKDAVELPAYSVATAVSVTAEEALALATDSTEGGELDPVDLQSGDMDNMKRPLSHSASFEVSESTAPKESLLTQTRWLAWRSWITTYRDPFIINVRVMQNIFLALLCGLIYLRLDHNSARVQNVAGALFFIVLQMAFGVILPTVQLLPAEVPVFLREHGNRMYRSSVYVLTKTLAGLPFNIMLPLLFSSVSYWMIGLNEDAGRFFTSCGITILTALTAESYGYLIASLSRDAQVAVALTTPMIIPLMLFGGLFLNSESTPVYFIWVEKISFIKYAFHAVMINEFHDAPNPACPSMLVNGTMMTPGRCFPDGNAVLDFYGMVPSELSLNIGILFVIGVVLRIMATLIFMFKVRKN